MAYAQVGVYGMNEKVGLVSFPQDENSLSKPYSNETAQLIDTEVRKMVDSAYARTKTLLNEKKDLVTALAERLLDREVSTCPKACLRDTSCCRSDLPAAAVLARPCVRDMRLPICWASAKSIGQQSSLAASKHLACWQCLHMRVRSSCLRMSGWGLIWMIALCIQAEQAHQLRCKADAATACCIVHIECSS